MNRAVLIGGAVVGLGIAVALARRRPSVVFPVQGTWRHTSTFGERVHPVTGERKLHAGSDFAAAVGTPVVAVRDGTVVLFVPNHAVAGNYLVVQHADKTKTRYLHLDRFAAGIRGNVDVRAGQVIGYLGGTGRVTGPHLHFEVLSAAGKPLDPRGWFPGLGRA